MKEIIYIKNFAPANRIDSIFLSEICFGTEFREFPVPRNDSEQNSETLLLYLFLGTEFRAFSSFAERFGTEFREFSVPRNDSEQNSETLLLFLFLGKEFRAFSSSGERFGTEFREFPVPRNSRNSAGTKQLFRLFRLPRKNFFVGNCQP
jgi:hypothetical protein